MAPTPPRAKIAKPDASSSISGNGTNNGNSHSAQSRIVSLAISESADAVEDAHLLREVIQVLLEYPGKDRVNLQIQILDSSVASLPRNDRHGLEIVS